MPRIIELDEFFHTSDGDISPLEENVISVLEDCWLPEVCSSYWEGEEEDEEFAKACQVRREREEALVNELIEMLKSGGKIVIKMP